MSIFGEFSSFVTQAAGIVAAKPHVRRSDFKTDLLGYLCIIKAAIMTSGDLFSVIMNTLTSYDVTVPVFLLTITVPIRKLLKMSDA